MFRPCLRHERGLVVQQLTSDLTHILVAELGHECDLTAGHQQWNRPQGKLQIQSPNFSTVFCWAFIFTQVFLQREWLYFQNCNFQTFQTTIYSTLDSEYRGVCVCVCITNKRFLEQCLPFILCFILMFSTHSTLMFSISFFKKCWLKQLISQGSHCPKGILHQNYFLLNSSPSKLLILHS